MDRPTVIAEIGCNHMGELDIAKQMVRVASDFCDVDYVKFQKRTPSELLSTEEYYRPHPVPHNSFGDTYGLHREYLEFGFDEHQELKEYADSLGIKYSTSVWELSSAKGIVPLKPEYIKVPSASNLDFELLRYLLTHYEGDIHISLGMTSHEEEDRIVEVCVEHKRASSIVLYACTSGYPVPFDDLALLEISRLRHKFAHTVAGIGFSGHHNGIAMDIAAVTLGAQFVERHFTLNRTWKGTDHAASLEPDGMRKLVRDLDNLSLALSYKDQEILEIEAAQREKLKRRV